ncbi:NPCBM/NEW2 domain-containing protein [Streptomyces capparidis]
MPSRPARRLTATLAALALAVTGLSVATPAPPASALDNGLARTPPMGFNNWNPFGCDVNERLIKETADIFVEKGFKAAGYTYVNIDDCWMARERDAQGRLVPDPVKFPNGIKAVADHVHAKGLKLGIYADAGTKTCAGYPGSLGHEDTDARSFASWGVDYLKYDNCHNNSDGSQEDFVRRYTAMGDALKRTGRPIVYSICEWGQSRPWEWAGGVGHLWRTTGDIRDNWPSVKSIIDANMRHAAAARPGAWNDPDMLEVGNGGMTAEEYRTHFGLWAVMAAPLLIGTDLRKASPETLDILLNRDVIAVDQDPLGIQGRVVSERDGLIVFDKPLADGDHAIALYNSTDRPATVSTRATAGGLPHAPGYRLRDLWTGRTTESAGVIGAALPPHATALYRVTPLRSPVPVLPPSTALSATAADAVPHAPGTATTVLADHPTPLRTTLTNHGRTHLRDVRLTATAPEGWTVTPTGQTTTRRLRTDASLTTRWTVTAPPGTPPGRHTLTVRATHHPGRTTTATLDLLLLAPPPAGATDLSSLDWVAAENGWGAPEKDRSNGELAPDDGRPLTIAGRTYPKGLGVHATSTLTYYLGGTCTRLTTEAGVDDEKPMPEQSAVFRILTDGTLRADSGPVDYGQPAVPLTADLTNTTWLTLSVLPNSSVGDHADWVGPVLECGKAG